MEAKDTVMDLDEYNRFTKGYYANRGKSELWLKADELGAEYKVTLEHQAEISFKAGQEEERRFILQNTDRDKRARLEGRKEVVDWVEQNKIVRKPFGDINNRAPEILVIAPESKWQAQLKVWGLEK